MTCTEERHPWFDHVPETFHSFQWHGDTFDLPTGARRLAESEGCGNQAFAYDNHVVALQFHLETSPAALALMLQHWHHELVEGPFIQSAAQMEREKGRSAESFRLLSGILDGMAKRV